MSSAVVSAEWLDDRRDAAASELDASAPPSDADEVWRYSRIADIELSMFGDAPSLDSGPDRVSIDDVAASITLLNGRIVRVERDEGRLGKSFVGSLTELEGGADLLGGLRRHRDQVSTLHDARLHDAVVVDVPRGVVVDGPIVVDSWIDAPGAAVATHVVVRAANGAQVTVLERRRSSEAEQLVLPEVELLAQPDARVGFLAVQELGRATHCLEQQWSDSHQQSHVVASIAAFGGSYARVRADFRLSGRGASGDLLAVYFGDGDQMLDFRTFQDHEAPDTTSNLLFKGAVTGSARSVYSGLIRVNEDAPGTNAFQTNRNLKLSDDAWAYSVPNLEIEQNQVACSHASTVGEIDEMQLFYLESRGVPTTVAEQLLVSGFFAEVIDQLPVDAVRGEMRAIVDAALQADRAAAS